MPGQASRAQQQAHAARRRGNSTQAGRGTPASPSGQGQQQATFTHSADATETPAGPAASRYYLDVSAVRIREWLARTPDLKFRRGASALLSQVARRSSWADEQLPPGTRWNDESGDADGVVSLVIDRLEPDPAHIARQVARRLRDAMPFCPLQAVVGVGGSYAEARQDMAQARQAGRFLVDSPAIPPEAIMARPCGQCRSAAATRPAAWKTGAGTRDLCDDCDARLKAAARTTGSQQRLRKALEDARMTVSGFPDEIQQVADAGRASGSETPSQVALIYAGGNGAGAFLSAAAASGVPWHEIASVIDAATIGALADAALICFRGWARPPVLTIPAGGDELLVSVPAADAWLFTRALLTGFGQRIVQETASWPGPARQLCPSLSAGLIFHRVTSPFSDLVQLASEQLREAENTTRGRAASVAFLDLTAEDSTAFQRRGWSLSLADLDMQAGLLTRIEAEIPASRQAMLMDLLRQGDAGTLSWRLRELGGSARKKAVAGRGAPPRTMRELLDADPEIITMLPRALDIARYWRASPRPEPGGC